LNRNSEILFSFQLELSNVKVIFLLGQLKNATFQSNVTTESETYGDILQEGFIDTYANLTVKSLMLLKWFSQECHKVPYVLKTDDDMYINLKQLFQLVRLLFLTSCRKRVLKIEQFTLQIKVDGK
jgi:hypothetical protein